MKRFSYISNLRAIATISVVFLHTSAGLLDTRGFNDQMVRFSLSCEKFLLEYAVPLFVLISGALFFNPEKEVTYARLIQKNVKRIALALLVFGLPMCFVESMFCGVGGGELLFVTLKNFLTGHCWNHMFYLYMLIGLYLLTPVLKPFLLKASDIDITVALATLGVLSSVLPTMNAYGISIGSYMIIGTPYIFIYVLGYVLAWRCNDGIWQNKCLLVVVILICATIIIFKSWVAIKSVQYIDPNLIIMASALFLLAKSYDKSWGWAEKFGPYSFGIYIVHCVFINLAYKLFGINEYQIYMPYRWFMWGCLFLMLSWISVWIMLKISFLRKHVL